MNKREWMLQAALAGMSGGFGPIEASELGGLYDAICAASPETPQEGAWVEHDGDVSKAPPEGVAIEVQLRSGSTCGTNSSNVLWDHDGSGLDIVRWRYA